MKRKTSEGLRSMAEVTIRDLKKSYDDFLALNNINLNLIEPSFIEQYVQITNIKHSNFNWIDTFS